MIKIKWSWFFKVISTKKNKYIATAFFVFLLYKDDKITLKAIRHEYIHFFQQLELLFIGFWILYPLSTLINLFKYKTFTEAYKNNIFEKEAYSNDNDPHYLITRKPYAWIKYS